MRGSYYSGGRTNRWGRSNRGSTVFAFPQSGWNSLNRRICFYFTAINSPVTFVLWHHAETTPEFYGTWCVLYCIAIYEIIQYVHLDWRRISGCKICNGEKPAKIACMSVKLPLASHTLGLHHGPSKMAI